jgi:predicted dehydrogenase
MGRHHARVYSQRPDAELVGVVDLNRDAATNITDEWGGTPCGTIDELLAAGVDAVTIATPTIHHRAAADRFIELKIPCLIEKPLAPNGDEARAIADAADAAGVVLQVGHIVRYDPVMQAIAKLDGLSPRFIEMDRVSPMTFRSVDVGVVLDMMIHDLDLLLMLTGSEPEEIQANAVCVLGEAEDVCNARLTFPAGADGLRPVANITASRLALKTERKLRVISENAYVSADFVARTGKVVRKIANDEQLADLRQRLKEGEDLSNLDYFELIETEDLDVQPGDALEMQIDDFIGAVREGRRPTIDAQAGFAAVRTAERIVETARAAGSRML